MGLIYGGNDASPVNWPLIFTPTGLQPIDNRMVVEHISDLNVKTTFYNKSYEGMLVYVTDVKAFYVLTDRDNNTWEKLPTTASLDELAKAFTFKGVASAIDEDRCIITVGYATDDDGEEYTIKQQAYDILKETMYGWSNADGNKVYWTHESTGDLSPVYIQGLQQYITCLIYQNEVYYFKSTNVYESLDGDFLYQDGSKYYLDEKHGQEVTNVTTSTYHGYKFTKVADFTLTLPTPQSGGIPAGPDNIGWVYQIGEEEYASNGSIWVQLGSPKEDWIIIK